MLLEFFKVCRGHFRQNKRRYIGLFLPTQIVRQGGGNARMYRGALDSWMQPDERMIVLLANCPTINDGWHFAIHLPR